MPCVSLSCVNSVFLSSRGAGGPSKDPREGQQPGDADADGGGGVPAERGKPRPVALPLAALGTAPPPQGVGPHRTPQTGKSPQQPTRPRPAGLDITSPLVPLDQLV